MKRANILSVVDSFLVCWEWRFGMKSIGFMVFGVVLMGFAAMRFWSPITGAILEIDMPAVDLALPGVEHLVGEIVNWAEFVAYGSNGLLAGFGLYFALKGVYLRGSSKLKIRDVT